MIGSTQEARSCIALRRCASGRKSTYHVFAMTPSKPLNPRTYRYFYDDPALAIRQLSEVEMCFERPGSEHTHRDWQVIAMLEGEASIAAGVREHALGPGSVCIVPPQVPHLTQPAPGRPRFTLVDLRLLVTPSVPVTQYLARQARGGVVVWKRAPEELAAVAADLRELLLHDAQPDPPAVMVPLWRLIARPRDASVQPTAPPPLADSRVLFVIATMRERIDKNLTMSQLARRAQLSRSQLGRLFQQQVGMAPTAYLQQLRLEQARQYLTSSTMSVKQIASACGFGNPNHFSRLFHEQVGTTPTAYRKREAEGAA